MSQENVEVVRRAWEASLRHDNEAAFALYDPQIEIEPKRESVDTHTYHGREGVQEFWRDMLSAFADMTSEVEEWIDAGDQVIAMVRSSGRGRHSGVPVDTLEGHLWTVRDGKLLRLQIFDTKAEALEAAGLSE